MSGLRTRWLTSDDDVKDCFKFLIPMYAEVGRVRGDPNRAFLWVYDVVKRGAAFMIFDGDTPIASFGAMSDLLGYAAEGVEIWNERWFWIVPGWRDKPEAFRLMLREIRFLVDQSGQPCKFTVFNEKRFRRRRMETVGETSWVMPAGVVGMVEPEGAGGDER